MMWKTKTGDVSSLIDRLLQNKNIYDNIGKDHISRIVLNKCDAGALETVYIVMHRLCGP